MAAGADRVTATVARVYGRALSRLAFAHKDDEEWTIALQTLVAALDSPAWCALMEAPGYSRKERAEKLLQLAGDALPERAAKLVRLLAIEGRLRLVAEIAAAYRQQMDLLRRRRRVQVLSAHRLNADEQKHLATLLEQRFGDSGSWQLTVEYDTDPTLIAGFVAHCGDRVLDSSLRGRFRQLAAAAAA